MVAAHVVVQLPTPAAAQKRKRASRPKVKTGCIVCKIRRVKCDETKPACLKCTSTGRKCDGYVKRDDSPTSTAQQQEALATALISSRPNNRVAIPRNPYTTTALSKDKVSEPFEFYRVVTLSALNRGTGQAPWNNTILQLSQQVPAIIYAGAAMGALSRRMRLIDVARNNGTINDVRSQALQLQNSADILYSKALTNTREQLSKSDSNATEAALVACFLLQSFEFLRGNVKGSLIHQINGMAILLRHNETAGRNKDGRSSSLLQHVNEIFKLWDMRMSAWMGFEKPLAKMVADATERKSVPALTNIQQRSLLGPAGFASLDHAMKVQRQLLTSLMSLANSINYWTARDDEADLQEELEMTRLNLLVDVDAWRSAFNRLVYEINSDLSEIDKKCVALLDITTRALRLRLLTINDPMEEAIYASQTDEFILIMNLTEPLLFPTNIMKRMNAGEKGESKTAEELPLAYYNLGIIQVLYHVATKCHDESIQNRAIEWLETDPWVEGGFHSAQAARIIRKSLGLPDQMDSLKLGPEIQPPGYYHHAHVVPMIADRC